MGLNGGPLYKFSPATSFIINCKTQEEVDFFWEKLSTGAKTGQCGWIDYDKFGLTWQVVPTTLNELMSSNDAKKSEAVMRVMLKMDKLVITELQKA